MISLKKYFALAAFTLTLSSCDVLLKTLESAGSVTGITQAEAAGGLKEALQKGVSLGVENLGKENGFLNNAARKILLPPEVREIEDKIRSNMFAAAFSPYMDKLVNAMNKGAENAMEEAKPIFAGAIAEMTIQDAISIVTGGDGAATAYLKKTTSDELKKSFEPVIEDALEPLNITDLWNGVSQGYNIVAGKKVTTNLNSYVTEKAMEGLFAEILEEENAIRANPAERTSSLLKKVFNYADQQKSAAQ